ncbi:hypothetical protein NAF17_08615 [Mucilaginibacter sp. RB4R14]|uniref:hypothetical protein n=1 Tax=Mucilaginibacter aurantiaciroseus TaxID=2949308 RepID=UPI00209075B9|nr:hypothetical protein [Mucilaginibacter aurantiaciroseus]MCO5935601.1 hypothetical protein [Mucilaginibacter aurantiaciroseus]
MYIRFITQFINEYGESHTGLFSALRFIREASSTQDEDVIKLKHIKDWFNENLEAPDRFSNANNKNPASISLSWFKDTAKEHIKKVYEIREVLNRYGIIVEVVTTKNPGYIVFTDDYQVSAIPFKTDRKKIL